MGELKEEIRAGNIPAFFRNTVVPSEAPGSQIWLAMLADGELARFDVDGNPIGVVSLQEPEMQQILSDFFSKNQEETNRPSLYPSTYVTDLKQVGSEVWVLFNGGDDEPALLVAFSQDFACSAPRSSCIGKLYSRPCCVCCTQRTCTNVASETLTVHPPGTDRSQKRDNNAPMADVRVERTARLQMSPGSAARHRRDGLFGPPGQSAQPVSP